jgi:D-glycero-D-manno-heptose 1,7-bisphosphate phosphatase
MKRRFVLLDRDGTINVERQYLSRVEDFELLPNALAGMRRFRELGLGMVVLTNQSGLARGYFDRAAVDAIHRRFTDLLEKEGIPLDGIYICPHVDEDDCACRKPAPGLARTAARELDFDPTDAFVVGDKPCDIELGKRLGATTLLVRTGYGEQYAADPTVQPDHVVADLLEAAAAIERIVKRVGATQHAVEIP